MTTSIRIRPDQEMLIRDLGINLSQFIKDKIDETYQNTDRIQKEIDELKLEIVNREKLLSNIVKERTKLTKVEIAYLIASKGILAKYGKESPFFANRFQSYLKQFNKRFISFEVFHNLVVSSK